MYGVEMLNPMVLAKWNFWKETPYIVTKNYFLQPKSENTPHNKILIIGMVYTKMLRHQWYSVDYPIKKTYVSQNPLVAATLSYLDKMLVTNFETSQKIAPSNMIKKDF